MFNNVFVGVLLVVTLVVTCEARVLLEDTTNYSLPSADEFVQRKGTEFVLNNSEFFFNGFNAYWMMHVGVDPTQRHKVSNVFREASSIGLTVCRTWAFSDGGDRALQISPGLYDELVFQALDFVVAEARKYQVKLILSLVNNYNDFGGRPQYVEWAKNASVAVQNDDDFYTNPIIKDYYKNHVKKVLTRMNTITNITYKDDPTIFAWELINEPRCKVDYSGITVNEWVEEMAPYVKSIDNNHLLEVGMEGFYGDSIPDRNQYNPEFGMSKKKEGYNISARDSFMNAVYSRIYSLAIDGGTFSGALVWQLMDEGMDSYFDGYEIVLSQNNSTTTVLNQQSYKMIQLDTIHH
ncbi:mannan endo-1,4-beta-mannosidase 5-like [Senna tora]|uniref:mannan endo-1,4-beta-mannosidase n=1 Tax=Senna tora TaxID=362788 RepID=A0A834WJ22_9FABA|nr:mannan endo-1,4-beta-mannosidase 5-like [Senna tora]